jgi:hypothetical protein
MTKAGIYLLLFFLIIYACMQKKGNESINLQDYLLLFDSKIESYKVICFLPTDGCGSCIEPSLYYANTSDEKMLLVLTSIYRKSMDYAIEKYKLTKQEIIFDSKNLAVTDGFVTDMAPSYFFLKDGNIIKKVDLSTMSDKKSIIEEVHKFIKN